MADDDVNDEELTGPDEYDLGYDTGVAQALCLVEAAYATIRHGGELRPAEVEKLLADIRALAE